MIRLCLSLLGPAHVTRRDRPCRLTPRLMALLAYLAVESDRPHRRESLAALFWPERPDSVALGSLRSALRDLRAALLEPPGGDSLLEATASEIRLRPDPSCAIDVATFSALLAPHDGAPDLARLEQALALYRGPFLEGFTLSASAEWEEWVLIQREALQRMALGALARLAAAHEARGDVLRATATWRRAIALEPCQEQAHAQLMHLLALSGRRSEAIAQFRRCEHALHRNLGVGPGPETIALYERIRDGVVRDAPTRSGAEGAQAPSDGAMRRIATVVPALWRPSSDGIETLVAREQELARLQAQLSHALDGEGRVIMVTGEAGSGKTALVQAFCRQAMRRHPDLLVAVSRCSARQGTGDPFQPFGEIVHMLVLAADGEPTPGDGALARGRSARLTVGALDGEHARRLQRAQPVALAALAQEGPDVMRLVAHGASLAARARVYARSGAAWAAEIEALIARTEAAALPDAQQVAIHEQFMSMLRRVASEYPLLLVLEDLQWADEPSRDLLFHLGRHLRDARILIVGTFRPEEDRHAANAPTTEAASVGPPRPLEALGDGFRREWGNIRVDLAECPGRRFVSAYLDTMPNRLGEQFRETLYHHTGGNALFTVELVRAMQERGDLVRDGEGRWCEGPRLAWEQLPPRVEGAIAQRLGQLSDAQMQLLTVASVEGVGFHAEVLARVLGVPEYAVIATLSGALGRERQIVEAVGFRGPSAATAPPPREGRPPAGGRAPMAHYRFRHELFQAYIYARLDPVHRAYLHARVGAALEELFGEGSPGLAGSLARHFQIAGEERKASTYLLEAGRQAAHVGAHRTAIDCYRRGLALLEDLPDDFTRAELELALQIALDQSLVYSRGWGAPERQRPTARAYELGQRLGWSSPIMLHALRAVADLSAARGEYRQAAALATRLLAAAEEIDSPLYAAAAHAIIGLCAAGLGDLPTSWSHSTQAIAFSQHPPHTLTPDEKLSLYPHAEIAAASVLLVRGNLDRCQQMMEQIVAEGSLGNLHIRGYTHCIAAISYAVRHQSRPARAQAAAALEAIAGRDMPELQAIGEGILAWCDALTDGGIARMKAALAAQPRQSTLIFRFAQMALLAEACLSADDALSAQEVVDAALEEARRTGARFYEADLVRVKGEVALRRAHAGDGDAAREAETLLREAIDIARQLGMRLWELRATASMARLWMAQGKRREARAALETVYATFTEGFATPDLVEAAALLEELAQ